MSMDEIKALLLEVIASHKLHPIPVNWSSLLCFCYGYFGKVTLEMVHAVRELEQEHWF